MLPNGIGSDSVWSVSVCILTSELNLTTLPILSPERMIVIVVDVLNVVPVIVMTREVLSGCAAVRVMVSSPGLTAAVGVTDTSKKPDG